MNFSNDSLGGEIIKRVIRAISVKDSKVGIIGSGTGSAAACLEGVIKQLK